MSKITGISCNVNFLFWAVLLFCFYVLLKFNALLINYLVLIILNIFENLNGSQITGWDKRTYGTKRSEIQITVNSSEGM